jgi:hypothetical protein
MNLVLRDISIDFMLDFIIRSKIWDKIIFPTDNILSILRDTSIYVNANFAYLILSLI